MENINQRIAACIAASKLTKTEFADRINVSQSFVSRLASGDKTPSDRTIADICREFDVNEHWLRTGEGEMFIKKSRDLEIAAFMGNVLKGEPDFRRRFIAVLSRMSADEWQLLERKIKEIANEP
ncbi:MAG TPA: helix-turn-helix transcriptional regulator [Clostridia bacterium]|nr:helix-turn-helix transcriptional regulator [Clostridia bacterium]